jgi:hypothetical protein
MVPSPRAKLRRVREDRFLDCMGLPRFHVERLVFYRRSASGETQGEPEFCKVVYQPTGWTAGLDLFDLNRKPGFGARFGML